MINLFLSAAQTSNTTGTAPVTSTPKNSPPVASLVGFCVVVSLLIVSVCVGMLIISKYGPKRCPCTTSMSMNARTASPVHISSPRPSQRDEGNQFHYPQQQQHTEHTRDSDQLQEQQEGAQRTGLHTRQLSNSSLQPSMSMVSQCYPPATIPPLQTRPMSHFPGVGYPYQPCKSPRTPHTIMPHPFDFQSSRGRPPPSQPSTPCKPGIESPSNTEV